MMYDVCECDVPPTSLLQNDHTHDKERIQRTMGKGLENSTEIYIIINSVH